ncbi:hypothetical protein [Veronia pacifica]|uniref:Uncharacterized protein n=1 Tax=Veronia pacifica TaxID=1080227 RepID=A0A1C3EBS9_9GAMM|nr:hypothetical protein [Veronia pacifica]ODA30706.1 hypothetical protein A8L45_19425 [Veronia pacifica]
MKCITLVIVIVAITGCNPTRFTDAIELTLSPKMSSELNVAYGQLLNCDYPLAQTSFQQYTVIGTREERAFAYRWLGVIYLEMMNFDEFDHLADRYLFTRPGRDTPKEQLIDDWRKAAEKMRAERYIASGVGECGRYNLQSN